MKLLVNLFYTFFRSVARENIVVSSHASPNAGRDWMRDRQRTPSPHQLGIYHEQWDFGLYR